MQVKVKVFLEEGDNLCTENGHFGKSRSRHRIGKNFVLVKFMMSPVDSPKNARIDGKNTPLP